MTRFCDARAFDTIVSGTRYELLFENKDYLFTKSLTTISASSNVMFNNKHFLMKGNFTHSKFKYELAIHWSEGFIESSDTL
ncbi:hypothetical protein LCO01nite_13960 [Lapidilactobacillus concavus]|nr:hypothetical protein LCO01nite_13960 [Lapidilactobacillus concavus]